jgi:hypothetical protein
MLNFKGLMTQILAILEKIVAEVLSILSTFHKKYPQFYNILDKKNCRFLHVRKLWFSWKTGRFNLCAKKTLIGSILH